MPVLLTVIVTIGGAQAQQPAERPPLLWHWLSGEPGTQSIEGIATGKDGRVVAVGYDMADADVGLIVGFTATGDEFMNLRPAFDEFRTRTNDVAILSDGRIAMSYERYYPREPTLTTIALYSAEGEAIDRVDVATFPRMDIQRTALTSLPDGGFAIAKAYAPENSLASDSLIVRYDADGQRVGEIVFDGPEHLNIADLAGLADGGIVAVGWSGTTEANHHWAVRLDADGKVVWERDFDLLGRLYAVAVLPDDEIVVGGFYAQGDKLSVALVRWMDLNGQQLFYRTVDTPWLSRVQTLAPMPDGGLAIAGIYRATEDSANTAFLFRTTPERQELWISALNAYALRSSYNDIAILPDGGIAVAGSIRIDGSVEAFVTDQGVGVTETDSGELGIDGVIFRLAPEE